MAMLAAVTDQGKVTAVAMANASASAARRARSDSCWMSVDRTAPDMLRIYTPWRPTDNVQPVRERPVRLRGQGKSPSACLLLASPALTSTLAPMDIRTLQIPGPVVIVPQKFSDARPMRQGHRGKRLGLINGQAN